MSKAIFENLSRVQRNEIRIQYFYNCLTDLEGWIWAFWTNWGFGVKEKLAELDKAPCGTGKGGCIIGENALGRIWTMVLAKIPEGWTRGTGSNSVNMH